jgi:hypothetical protein
MDFVVTLNKLEFCKANIVPVLECYPPGGHETSYLLQWLFLWREFMFLILYWIVVCKAMGVGEGAMWRV